MPEITTPWPDAKYFRYGAIYTAPELKYKGQSFDYITMPDQYTLAAFQKAELAKPDRAPVMAGFRCAIRSRRYASTSWMYLLS